MEWAIIFVVFFTYLNSAKAIKCTAQGRFLDNSQPNCRGYTMCLSPTVSFDLLCPGHSIYSHLDSQCTNVTTYQCLPDYNCTNEGNYLTSDDCKSYTACVKDLNNITTARLVACPANQVFSESESICVNEAVCKKITEAPKVFQGHEIKITTLNVTFNNGGSVYTTKFLELITICIICLIFS